MNASASNLIFDLGYIAKHQLSRRCIPAIAALIVMSTSTASAATMRIPLRELRGDGGGKATLDLGASFRSLSSVTLELNGFHSIGVVQHFTTRELPIYVSPSTNPQPSRVASIDLSDFTWDVFPTHLQFLNTGLGISLRSMGAPDANRSIFDAWSRTAHLTDNGGIFSVVVDLAETRQRGVSLGGIGFQPLLESQIALSAYAEIVVDWLSSNLGSRTCLARVRHTRRHRRIA
jgi:hypothetical protein